jgi:hypothetical protein
MPETLRFHPEVKAEIREALLYGAERWPDLVFELLDEYEARVDLVLNEDPQLRREIDFGAKRINLRRRFPYHVIYYPKGDSIFVIAFCHNSKRPKYWKDRLEGIDETQWE